MIVETILFGSDLFKIGRFRLAADDPQFGCEGFVKRPLIVFPHHSIWIKHHGQKAFVADPSVINLYNHNQSYQRFAIDEKGDFCHWIEPSEQLLSHITRSHGNATFSMSHYHCSLKTYLNYQALLAQLNHRRNCDLLELETCALNIVTDLSEAIKNSRKHQHHIKPAHLKLVQRVKNHIHNNLFNHQSLSEIAAEVYSSPFHMSRVFKKVTTIGINHYKTQLRLKSAYNAIVSRRVNLTNLALDCGFSSHSHLTHRFKNYFGFTPLQLRSSLNS